MEMEQILSYLEIDLFNQDLAYGTMTSVCQVDMVKIIKET